MQIKNAIENKLNSKLDLKSKCTLARNVFLADNQSVKLAQKEEIILDWIVKLMLKKFSTCSEWAEENELWNLLLKIGESPKFDGNFVIATQGRLYDLLNHIVDHSFQSKDESLSASWLSMVLHNHRLVRSELFKQPESLNHFVAKCLQNNFASKDVVWAYSVAVSQNNGNVLGSNFNDILLPKLLARNSEEACKIVGKGLFSKDKAGSWNTYLKSLIEEKDSDSKPKNFDIIEGIFRQLSSMSYSDQLQSTCTLFQSCAESNAISDQTKCLLFFLLSNILTLYPSSEDIPQLTPLATTLLPSFRMEPKEKIACLGTLTELIIKHKLDLTTLLVPTLESSSMLRMLQYLLKNLLDKYEDQRDCISLIAVKLAEFSPFITEPLVGNLALSVIRLEKVELTCQLICLYQKLRQLPKLIARIFIALGKSNDKISDLDSQIIECFADKVKTLPLGQVLDLWKTFEYQLKNYSDSTKGLLDQLMSTFVVNACQVEQSIPDLTMNKITASIKEVDPFLSSFPRVKHSINELSLTLKYTRGFDQVGRTGFTNFQKRKLESIEHRSKKVRLDWEDLKTSPGSWQYLLSELSDEQLNKAVDGIIKDGVLVKELFEENERLQNVLISKALQHCKETPFIKCLKEGSLDIAAEKFEATMTFKNDHLYNLMESLPLEHLSGEIEAKLTLLFLSMASGCMKAKKLLSRCLFNGFRSSSLLKFMDPIKALEILFEIQQEQDEFFETSLRAICKASVTFKLAKVEASIEKFEDVNNERWVSASVSLLENVEPVLISATTNQEKKKMCLNIFNPIAKCLLKAIKSKSNLESSTISRALTSIINVYCHQEDKKPLKKWATFIMDHASFSALDCPDFTKFLSTVLVNYDNLKDRLSPDFLAKLSKSDFHKKSCENRDLLKLLFQVIANSDLELFKEMLGQMTETTLQQDKRILANWTTLIKTKLATEEALNLRKDYCRQILFVLQLEDCDMSKEASFYWPILEVHQALLESEKPILGKEEEAFCLAQCIALDICSENLEKNWNFVAKILSTAFFKRPTSLVVTRIPLILAGIRKLLFSLAQASDQKKNLSASQLKTALNLSYSFERLCDHIKKLKDEFARVAPYLIADVMEAFQTVTLYPAVRTSLLHGLHKLLDICDTHSVDYLSSVLEKAPQEMFKHVYANYKQYYKYAGRV